MLAFSLNNEVVHYRPGESTADRIHSVCGSCAVRWYAGATTCVHQCLFTGDELEELVDVNELYSDLFIEWCHWHRRLFTTGQCVHMCYSGARSRVMRGCESRLTGGRDIPDGVVVPFLQGASCVAACDAAAIRAATERGYGLAHGPPNHTLPYWPRSHL